MDNERERALKGLNTTLAWLQEAIVISGVLAIALVDCKSFQRKGSLWHLPTWCHTGTFFPHCHVTAVTQKWHAVQRYKRAKYGHLLPKMRRLFSKLLRRVVASSLQVEPCKLIMNTWCPE